MSEARRKIDAVVEAVLGGKKIPVGEVELHRCLENLYHEEGLEWKCGDPTRFAYYDAYDDQLYEFFVEFFPEDLDDQRRRAIEAGAEPTEAEIGRWRAAFTENFLDDPDWHGWYEFHPLHDSQGREAVVLLRKTGGGWDYEEKIQGVYRTQGEAERVVLDRQHTILEVWP